MNILIAFTQMVATTTITSAKSSNTTGATVEANCEVEVEVEFEVNEGVLSMLVDMGIQEHLARRALQGTNNGDLDAVFGYLESHENDPEFNKPPVQQEDGDAGGNTDAVADAGAVLDGSKKKKKKARYIPIELQRLFAHLKLIDQYAISTNGKCINNINVTNVHFQYLNSVCLFLTIYRTDNERV